MEHEGSGQELGRCRAVLRGGGGDLRNTNRNEGSRGRSLLPGLGTFSTSKVGGWWRLVAVGGGWWRLVTFGGWRLVAAGGWRFVVPGGLSLRAVLGKQKENLAS